MTPDTTPLAFPCLISCGRTLLRASRSEFLAFHCRGRTRDGRWLLRNLPTADGRHAPGWLLDRNAALRVFELHSTRRAWAAGLRWLWDGTLAECELSPPQTLSAAQLLERVAESRAEPPLQTAAQVRAYLRELAPAQLLDATHFRAFWDRHGYPLDDSEWRSDYP